MLPTMDLVYLLAAFFAPAAGAAVLALAWRWERRAHHEVRALLHDERHARSAAELRLARLAAFVAERGVLHRNYTVLRHRFGTMERRGAMVHRACLRHLEGWTHPVTLSVERYIHEAAGYMADAERGARYTAPDDEEVTDHGREREQWGLGPSPAGDE